MYPQFTQNCILPLTVSASERAPHNAGDPFESVRLGSYDSMNFPSRMNSNGEFGDDMCILAASQIMAAVHVLLFAA